jgi:hypothetical protein
MTVRRSIARRSIAAASLAVSAGLASIACTGDFDTTRSIPPRGTLGRELFTVVCDRVGAQSLREDVTGASFHAVCHPDPATGAYADKVDVSQLPELHEPAYDAAGQLVPLAQQQASRTYSIARIEALARRREDVVGALDAALPDTRIPTQPVAGTPCDPPPSGPDVGLHQELSSTLSRLIDLYDDADQSIPSVTRGFGRALEDVRADPDAQAALAHLDARQGYRPLPVVLGSVRPLLAYPRLVELARSVVGPMVAPSGDAAAAWSELQAASYQELRTPGAPGAPVDLVTTQDPSLGRAALSRPRSLLEGMRDVLSMESAQLAVGPSRFLVRRDSRGYAAVSLVNGIVPPPFVDATGPNGAPDGLPDVDALGQFVTSDGIPVVSPFFSPDGRDGARDALGRALDPTGSGALVYDYVDTRQTALAALAHDVKPFFAPGAVDETAMAFLGALPVLAGSRDATPVATKVYPPDPRAVDDWKLGHTGEPPATLGKTPVTLTYRAFHPEDSALADLAYAVGQVLGTPEMDDLLTLAQQLFADHPNDLASLLGLALEIRAIAQNHPEAQLPEASTFFDDLFVQLAAVAHEKGLLEDVLRAFADPKTLPMEQVLIKFFSRKDDVSYDANDLNGPSKDLGDGTAPPDFTIPVDRSQPDVGANRSEMQKFLQLLHDTNGLSICTKDNAIVHIRAVLPNTTIPINFDYPTDPVNTPLVCGLVGKSAPSKLEKCAVFGYQNVMTLLLDVLLGKALLTVRDPCLNALMSSPLAAFAGGADHFLEEISGVDGFSLHPNLRGFARLLYFQAPYPGLPSDPNPNNALTSNFLKDTIDPIPSMVCDSTPFTASDGTVFPLRTCNTVDDVLRARDPDALFPVDELGFVPSLQPLAGAFDAHHLPLLFANLFDVLHLHWGSPAQPKSVCDPTLPRSNPRWCAQSNLVSYEPLFVDVLQNGVFGRVQSFLGTLASMKVPHCTQLDPQSHMCMSTTLYDGLHVVAEALSLLLDSTRTPGLVDRNGGTFAPRNDGQKTDPLTAMDLLVDGFKQIDRSFASFAAAHPSDAGRQAAWRSARSKFVDTFLSVDGQGAAATFHNPTLITIAPKLLAAIREQVAAQCPGGPPCAWGQSQLATELSDALRGPTFAALVDLADALRRDDGARAEVETLVSYLLDPASNNEAQAGILGALLDATQIYEDQTNLLDPVDRVLARAVRPAITDDAGDVVQRSLADAALRSLAKIVEVENVTTATGVCTRERDPNRVIDALLTNLVTPMGPTSSSPVEVLMSVMGDVNRADPSKTTKFGAADYANVANEMSDFCLDQTRGLEQFYNVIRFVTNESN